MISFEYGKYYQEFPEKWEELSPKQLVKCISYIHSYPVYEAQLLIMQYLSNRHFKSILYKIGEAAKKENDNFGHNTIQLNAFRAACDWILKPPSFDKWNFPSLFINGVTYYGPTDTFSNLTIQEFGEAEYYFKKASEKTTNTINLNKFMACLFRPKKYFLFGERKTYTDDFVRNYHSTFNCVDLPTKRAILLNFSATRDSVFSRFKEAFSKGTKSDLEKYGWNGIILTVSVDRHMHPDLFKKRMLLEVLVEFEALAIRNRENKPTKDND
jgi:hypothetical protein